MNHVKRNLIFVEVAEEIQRAETKHPAWPDDEVYGAAIVAEESGEVTRAAVQYKMEGGSLESIREEAIQTIATSMRLIASIDFKTNRINRC